MATAACAISFKEQTDGTAALRKHRRGSASCALVPLAEGGTTVGAPSLPQRKAEEEAQGEEEDGTQDSQAGEVVLQDANSAEKHHYWHHVIKTSFYNQFKGTTCRHFAASSQLSFPECHFLVLKVSLSCRRHRAFSVF